MAASPSHLPRMTSRRRTGRVTTACSTPDSISPETDGEAMADALRATMKLNMNMNRMKAVGSAPLTSPEVICAAVAEPVEAPRAQADERRGRLPASAAIRRRRRASRMVSAAIVATALMTPPAA